VAALISDFAFYHITSVFVVFVAAGFARALRTAHVNDHGIVARRRLVWQPTGRWGEH